MNIVKADNTDLREILDLQYLAYQSEAALFGSKDIPPLKETLSELETEFKKGIILKMVDDIGNIIGSVRSKSNENTVYIGKLMVHPDEQKNKVHVPVRRRDRDPVRESLLSLHEAESLQRHERFLRLAEKSGVFYTPASLFDTEKHNMALKTPAGVVPASHLQLHPSCLTFCPSWHVQVLH